MTLFKNAKQKNFFLFVLICSIASISVIIGIIFISISAREFGNQVEKVREYLDLNSAQNLIEKNGWTTQGIESELGKWASQLKDLSGHDDIMNKIDDIIKSQGLLKEIDTPLFAYGIFLLILGIISSIGTGLYGNSIFNKKYQK